MAWLSRLLEFRPVTRREMEEYIMAKIDEVLHHVADKLDAAADRITEELTRLEQELKRGRPSPETVARVKASVEKLHGIVPETAEEDKVPYEPEGETGEGEEGEEAGEEHAEHE